MVMRAREGASESISAKTTVEQTSIEPIKSTERGKKCLSLLLQRKWVVLIASVLSQVIGVGFVFSLGVFYVELMDAFEVSRTDAAWVASLAVGVSQVGGMLAGAFVNVLGCGMTLGIAGIVSCLGLVVSFFATSVFYLYLSFGVTVGVAVSLVYSSSTACVSQVFQKGRAKALALVMVGQATGAALQPLLFQLLIDIFSWRGALLFMAGLLLNLCVLGSLVGPSRASTERSNHQSAKEVLKSSLDVKVFKTPRYIIYVTGRLMFGFGVAVMYTVMVDFMISKGFSRQTGTRMLVYFNIGNICGRLLSFLLLVKRNLSPLDLHIGAAVILTSVFMLYPWLESFISLLVVSIIGGLSLGVVFGTFAAIPAQLMDPKFYPTAFGLQLTFQGVGNLLAPPLTAWITDSTGTYGWAMIAIGCCMLVGVALFVTVRVRLCRLQGHAEIL